MALEEAARQACKTYIEWLQALMSNQDETTRAHALAKFQNAMGHLQNAVSRGWAE